MNFTFYQKQRIEEIFKKYNLKLVLLFGSQVLKKVTKESDIDIAVLPQKFLSFKEEIELISELINILGNVDVTNLRKASPLLLKEIIDNCQILYPKGRNEFDRLEVYALQKFAEAKVIFKMHRERIKEFIQGYD